jgi:hypothetical protein
MIICALQSDINAIYLDAYRIGRPKLAIGNIYKHDIDMNLKYRIYKKLFSRMNHDEMCENLSVVTLGLSGVLF